MYYFPWHWCDNNPHCEPKDDPNCSCEDTPIFNDRFAGISVHEAGHCYYKVCYNENNEGPHACLRAFAHAS